MTCACLASERWTAMLLCPKSSWANRSGQFRHLYEGALAAEEFWGNQGRNGYPSLHCVSPSLNSEQQLLRYDPTQATRWSRCLPFLGFGP